MEPDTQQKLFAFFETNKEKLIQIYIKERQSKQELGALVNFITGNDVKSVFYSISDPTITDEVKKDIIEKNNYRNTNAFFYLIDTKNNFTLLKVLDLEPKT